MAMTLDDLSRLDPKKIGNWPILPKLGVLILLFVVIIALSYFLDWQNQLDELDTFRKHAQANSEQPVGRAPIKRVKSVAAPEGDLRQQSFQRRGVRLEHSSMFRRGARLLREIVCLSLTRQSRFEGNHQEDERHKPDHPPYT